MKRLVTIIGLLAFGGAAWAALPVVPAENQAALLQSDDPALAKNKRIAYDFFRVVLRGLRLERARDFMREDYMQHNPNADTGLDGFLVYFQRVLGDRDPPPIPEELPGLVSITAEGDLVSLAFVRECNGDGNAYSTTWFDMFRIEGDKIAEHWDSALLGGGSGC